VHIKSYFREEALSSDLAKINYSYLILLANPDDEVALRYLLGFGSNNCRNSSYYRLAEKAQLRRIKIKSLLVDIINGNDSVPYTSNIVDKYREIKRTLTEYYTRLRSDPSCFLELFTPSDNEDLDELREVLITTVDSIGLCDDPTDIDNWMKKIYQDSLNRLTLPDSPLEVDHVRIMSLHSSKGLNAKFVLITSCIEGLIPREDINLSDNELRKSIEEQRRLLYVAMTRCKNYPDQYQGTLILSTCTGMPGTDALRIGIPSRADRFRDVISSRFLSELGNNRPDFERGFDYLERL